MTARLVRRACAVLVVTALALALGACSSDSGPKGTPTEVLTAAKKSLDDTSGVTLSLSAPKLPEGVDGVLDAKGVATHAPAFEGKLTVVVNGLDVAVPVISVGGKVYAKLPFTASYAEINPADYGAPDPARLLDPGTGLSSWLTRATDLKKGARVRKGDTVLTAYTGTLPGSAVAATIPSADKGAEFPVSFQVDDQGRLRAVEVSGPFYGTDGEVDYTVGIDDYGTQRDIEAP